MAWEEYKGYHVSVRARKYRSGCTFVGIVCKLGRLGSFIEVKRTEGGGFENKEEAEQHGLELCKEWIDKQL